MKTCVCATCGKVFETNHKRKYCCPACRDSVRLKDWTDVVWSKCNPHPPCLWCGKQATRHDQKGFCSRDCANAYKVYVNQYEREKESRLLEVELLSFVSDEARAEYLGRKEKLLQKLAGTLRNAYCPQHSRSGQEVAQVCQCCGQTFAYIAGKTVWSRYCSDECRRINKNRKHQEWRKTEQGRDYECTHKTHKKRAEFFGCEFDSSVTPNGVFERDFWTCQLCKRKTPKGLKGTVNPNAPTLDHIVPLSKGGGHMWSNVQCLCRRCNTRKGAKTGWGSGRLF